MINSQAKTLPGVDGRKLANPQFRTVQKEQWVDQKRPFRVVKVDRSVRLSTEKESDWPTEPFTELNGVLLSKRVDDFYSDSKKAKEELWSPDAVKRREQAEKDLQAKNKSAGDKGD